MVPHAEGGILYKEGLLYKIPPLHGGGKSTSYSWLSTIWTGEIIFGSIAKFLEDWEKWQMGKGSLVSQSQ